MGKRARIPTQKAIMVKEAQNMKGYAQRVRKLEQVGKKSAETSSKAAKSGMKSADSSGLDELATMSETMKQQQAQAGVIWNRVVQSSRDGSPRNQVVASNHGRMKWRKKLQHKQRRNRFGMS
ncbi:hypothetical protein RDI58_025089 [Solanum bulbocastanum]|uniref:Uncharacterized protein n=1 Tax=Solanum bulbocastanum TaxID=147425 RepID=A0AAN8T734_SOLBU